MPRPPQASSANDRLRAVGRWPRGLCAFLLLWGGVGLLASPASAQEAEGTRRRPLERQPTLPAEPVPDEPARLELPPIPRSARPDALSSGLRTYVREYRFEGNRAIEDAELAAVAAPWTGRAITSEELLALRDALTRHYVERGYVTSGALIPDQSVEDGVIELRIVEGRLTDIEIQGQRWFRETTLRNRLAAGTSDPVNVAELQEQLQLLQRDVRIRATHARLVPGEQLGESRLVVRIEEEHPFFLSLGAANDRSPSIGDEFGRLRTGHRNLLGLGDAFSVAFNGSEGLSDWEGRYALPVSPHGTLLELFAEGSHSEVVNGPFRDAEIESEYSAYGASLRHPLLRTTRDELVIGLTGERRRSSTEIFGRETSFGPGSEDGVSKVFALRAFQEWTRQTRDQVIAVRSIVSFGLDAFDATTHSDSSVPDGRYVAWLAQGQWARRLDWPARETLAIARADLQLSDDPLLSLEQFSIGGLRTVRGFPENQVVRDNGFVASIEVRIPIWRNARRGAVLELAPFVDYGWVWDRRRHRRVFRFDQDPPTEVLASAGRDSAVLASAGLGLRYRVAGRLSAYVYWGGRLKKVERIDSSDLQNHGFHVGVSFELY